MADQQKRTEGPLNAFYAALLSGKLSLGSLGSSFGGPTPRAAMKRKPEDKSSISEPSKKQRTQQQKVVHEPSKSAKPNQGCATSKLRERQQQKKQPASSEKGSASSGKKLVPAWQKVDSDDSGDEGIEKGADTLLARDGSRARAGKAGQAAGCQPEAQTGHRGNPSKQKSTAAGQKDLGTTAQKTASHLHRSLQQNSRASGRGVKTPSAPETPPQSVSQGRVASAKEAAHQSSDDLPGTQLPNCPVKASSRGQMTPGQEVGERNSAAVWQQHLHEKEQALPPKNPTAKPKSQGKNVSTSRAKEGAVLEANQKGKVPAGKNRAAAAGQPPCKGSSTEVINLNASDVIDLVSSDEGGSAASSPSSRHPLQSASSQQQVKSGADRQKEEGKSSKPVPPSLLSALGFKTLGLATYQPQCPPAKPGSNVPALVRGCRPSLLADFPQPKFPALPYSNCELPKDLRHVPKTADHRHDRLPRPGEKAPHVSKKPVSPDKPKGQAVKAGPQKCQAAASSKEPRPVTSRLKSLQASKEMTQQAQAQLNKELAPRTKCEAKGVPVYFYSDEPPQDPEMPPVRREPEQDVQRAKDTGSIWGNFQTKPRNGADTRIMPVNTAFHISSITDPHFRLGGKPFKYCFPLQEAKPGKPERIIGEERRALRKFAEPTP